MKRFDIEVYGGRAYLVGNPSGKYVQHEDVAELERQCVQLLAALELLTDAVGANCDADQDEMAVKPAMKRARAAIAAVKGAPC